MSEELLSAFTILLVVASYIGAGSIFTSMVEGWFLLDSIYFWVVTFTTVGLGDLLHSDKVYHNYMIPLIVYRTFGLALLAGFIDSLVAWINVRKKAFQKRRAEGKALCCGCLCKKKKHPLPGLGNLDEDDITELRTLVAATLPREQQRQEQNARQESKESNQSSIGVMERLLLKDLEVRMAPIGLVDEEESEDGPSKRSKLCRSDSNVSEDSERPSKDGVTPKADEKTSCHCKASSKFDPGEPSDSSLEKARRKRGLSIDEDGKSLPRHDVLQQQKVFECVAAQL